MQDLSKCDLGLTRVAAWEWQASAANYRPLPAQLLPSLRHHLERAYPNGLYRHQATGLDAFLAGSNVCLATGTASGKSLFFMAATLHSVCGDSAGTALIMYPLKALIQDQYEKWSRLSGVYTGLPAVLSGDVDPSIRSQLLETSRIVLATPDVVHSWLLPRRSEPAIKRFLQSLRVVVIDEAHVYEGAFGTNMAYMLRRLEAAAAKYQVLAATATISNPAEFCQRLTGCSFAIVDSSVDGAPQYGKVMEVYSTDDKHFDSAVRLLRWITQAGASRFLAFADSRRLVEQIVSAAKRNSGEVEDDRLVLDGILPYRSGYEDSDRLDIQTRLTEGQLRGVLSTSALEAGLDIGDIDTVIMLSTPKCMKSFWQRVGRCGRTSPGRVIILDADGRIRSQPDLEQLLQMPMQRNHLYLDNRFVQYSHALCAAAEGLQASHPAFATLPELFAKLLDNEVNPTAPVEDDLFPLKQRAQDTPQVSFPLRSITDQQFEVSTFDNYRIGHLTLSQVLREAYPGAIYYYISRPYRIVQVQRHKGTIVAKRDKPITTHPITHSMVFPKFQNGILNIIGAQGYFVVEAETQVAERVIGFTEVRGGKQTINHYGPQCSYARKPVSRYFETTGVCFSTPSPISTTGIELIQAAFCECCNIQSRDLGNGCFSSKRRPDGVAEPFRGFCIYDGNAGSLRLTSSLFVHIEDVLESAIQSAAGGSEDRTQMRSLLEVVKRAQPVLVGYQSRIDSVEESDWIELADIGERILYVEGGDVEELRVLRYRMRSSGLYYQVHTNAPDQERLIPIKHTRLLETTRVVQFNVETREVRLPSAGYEVQGSSSA